MADIGVDSVSLQCEQRIVIKFLVKEGTPVVEIVKQLKAVLAKPLYRHLQSTNGQNDVRTGAFLLMMTSELERHALPLHRITLQLSIWPLSKIVGFLYWN